MSVNIPLINFDKCVPKCELSKLHPTLIEKLGLLSLYCGFEIKVNSAYRSYEWEKSKGRAGTSTHCKGLAIDIHTASNSERGSIVCNAVKLGFKRIGVYPTFVHLDLDTDKVSPCMWLG